MSTVFYDHLIVLDEIHEIVVSVSDSHEEKMELWNLVDHIIHKRVLVKILDLLPREDHENFLERFHAAPYDENHILFINARIDGDVSTHIVGEIKLFKNELLKELLPPQKKSKKAKK
jgi:hypothetical protein